MWLLTCRAADHSESAAAHATDSTQQQHDNSNLAANESWSTVSKKGQRKVHVPIIKPDMHLSDWCSKPTQDLATADSMPWRGVRRSSTFLQSAVSPLDAVCTEQAGWNDSPSDPAATITWDTDSSAANTWGDEDNAAPSLAPTVNQRTWDDSEFHYPQGCPKQSYDWDDQGTQEQAHAEYCGPNYSEYACHFCNQPGHIQRHCPAYQAASAKPRPKKDFTLHRCHCCGQYGHVAYQCKESPGQMYHPASHREAAPWDTRSDKFAAPPQSAGSAEMHPGTRDHVLSSINYQPYSLAREPSAHFAPAQEGQQSGSRAPSATGQPQLLIVTPYRRYDVDGMSCKRNYLQREPDGWDEGTADPPFAPLQLPPKPSLARSTPKIKVARRGSAHLSVEGMFQDDMSMPEQDAACQDSSQHTAPVTSQVPHQGHPAFPQGIIKPAVDVPPSPSSSTGPLGVSPPGQEPFTEPCFPPRPRPRPQPRQQSTPGSRFNPGGLPEHKSCATLQPAPRAPCYEPHKHEQLAYRSPVPARPHTQQAPLSSGLSAPGADGSFMPAAHQNLPAAFSTPASRQAAMHSCTDPNRQACNSLTPLQAATESAHRASRNLFHDSVPGSQGIFKACSGLSLHAEHCFTHAIEVIATSFAFATGCIERQSFWLHCL